MLLMMKAVAALNFKIIKKRMNVSKESLQRCYRYPVVIAVCFILRPLHEIVISRSLPPPPTSLFDLTWRSTWQCSFLIQQLPHHNNVALSYSINRWKDRIAALRWVGLRSFPAVSWRRGRFRRSAISWTVQVIRNRTVHCWASQHRMNELRDREGSN